VPGSGGLGFVVAQGKGAWDFFAGAKTPDARIERITASLSQSTQNIILIGMPGCGKSSIGAALSIKLGREFTDTDELVETTAGKPIPAIFAQDGESAFRALETAVLAELCKQSGMVIATGGGIVTRPENRHIIRQNGTVVFLDRDISELPLSGRPLSEKDGVAKLAETRMPLYLAWSDHAIPVHSVEHAAAAIHEKLFGGAQL
ncbi:MAG: shikimate kinase, partial [Clostridiales bacterium]|nr:shikimate kinase [Clostridiales bacterium]